MEQQIKAEQVEQYKREMLAQARRTQAAPAAQATAQAQAVAQVNVITPAPAPVRNERVAAAEHVERVLARAEPIVEAVEPFAQAVLPPLAAAAAKGVELGVEALEDHLEHRRAEQHAPPAPPPSPPAPAPPTIDIEFNPQITQTAPAIVAPVVTAPAIVAPTVTAPAAAAVVMAPPVQAPVPPPPPVIPVPLPVPPPPVPMPVPIPLPPAPIPVPVPRPQPPPPASILIPPVPVPVVRPMQPAPIPVAVPIRPAPAQCGTTTHTFTMTGPCRSACKTAARLCCQAHAPRPQSCCASRRPVPCRPAPCACNSKTPRVLSQAGNWFAQPAVEAVYAAYTASLAPDDDAMRAFQMPEAVQVSAAPVDMTFAAPADVAYAEPEVNDQSGWFELPAQDYASLEDYLARNTARGILELQVRVASDNGAPVPGANVDILKTIAGTTYLFFHGVTDANGSAGRISLPAPDRNLSFAPPQGFVPYAVYTVSVSHGDYAPQVFENVTVFPDTEAVQVVRLGQASMPTMMDEARYVM